MTILQGKINSFDFLSIDDSMENWYKIIENNIDKSKWNFETRSSFQN